MPLDAAQLVTIGNHIRANTNQAVIDALAVGNNNAIVTWYNQDASPDFWAFRQSVDVDEVRRSLDWNEVLDAASGLTQLQQWGFNTLLHNGTFDPTELNNRNCLVKIFPASMPNTRAAILEDSTRLASEAEKLFAVPATGPAGGDGSGQNSAAALAFVGPVVLQDIRDALEATV